MSITCYIFRCCNLETDLSLEKKVHFLSLPHHSCCLVSTSWLLQQRILFHIWIKKIMQNLWQICNIWIISSPPTQSKQVIQMLRLQTGPPPVGSHVPANLTQSVDWWDVGEVIALCSGCLRWGPPTELTSFTLSPDHSCRKCAVRSSSTNSDPWKKKKKKDRLLSKTHLGPPVVPEPSYERGSLVC